MAQIELSIMIPTHRHSEGALRLLRSIWRQQLDFKKIEVCVVANPHDPVLQEEVQNMQVEGWPVVYVTSRLGVNSAKNFGIQCATGSMIYFIDDDCELIRPDHLQIVLQNLKDKNVSAIGGSYCSQIDKVEASKSLLVRAYNLQSNLWLHQFVSPDQSTRQLLGGNAGYRREVFDHFQFDEKILYGGDEVAVNDYLFRAGHLLKLNSQLTVLHSPPLNLKKFLTKALRQGQNQKVHPKPARSVMRLALKELIAEPVTSAPLFVLISIYHLFFKFASAIKHIKLFFKASNQTLKSYDSAL